MDLEVHLTQLHWLIFICRSPYGAHMFNFVSSLTCFLNKPMACSIPVILLAGISLGMTVWGNSGREKVVSSADSESGLEKSDSSADSETSGSPIEVYVDDRQSRELGISIKQPDTPYHVPLPDGTYMVPYTVEIPGTEVTYTMIPVPGGRFLLGSPEGDAHGRDDERPQVEVSVEPFWIGKYEVTWAEYQIYLKLDLTMRRLQKENKFLVDSQNQVDAVSGASALYDTGFVFHFGSLPDSPAAMMTHFAATQYTKFLSLLADRHYRLPTEAEWEYACRAGTKTTWHFGDDPQMLKDYGWFEGNSPEESRHRVGQKLPNPWGLYDMYGNVAEWTRDRYSSNGYQDLSTVVAGGGLTSQQAFQQPTELFPKVLRGGGIFSEPCQCRSASRKPSAEKGWKLEDPDIPQSPYWYTDEQAVEVGFRIIRPLVSPSTREEKEADWLSHPQAIEDAKSNFQRGRGAYGIVNPDLAIEIQEDK